MEMWKACENVSCVPETNGGTNCSLWGSIQKKKKEHGVVIISVAALQWRLC